MGLPQPQPKHTMLCVKTVVAVAAGAVAFGVAMLDVLPFWCSCLLSMTLCRV